MRKINNPYINLPNYRCFACSPDNPKGLHMSFYEENNSIFCRWNPDIDFQGFPNILHGGIQATLIDEIAGWFISAKLGTSGVTSKLEITYNHGIYLNQGEVLLSARLGMNDEKTAEILVDLSQPEDKIRTTAVCRYFLFPEKLARRKLAYPGVEAFF